MQRAVRLWGPVPSDQDPLAHRLKRPGVRQDEDRPTGGKHNVLRSKSRGAVVRLGIWRALSRNRYIDRFCQLDQRRRVAVGHEVPLALDAGQPQLAPEVLFGRFRGLGLTQ